MREQMAEISQIEMGEGTRRYSEEEEASLMKEIMKNNEMIIKLQKQIGELQIVVKEEGKRKEREAEARIVEEKENEEKDLIELRATEEMVPKRFHKYLKVFEKKDSERMPTRKTWDHAIDLKEGFVPKKGKIYPLSRVEREEVQEFVKD